MISISLSSFSYCTCEALFLPRSRRPDRKLGVRKRWGGDYPSPKIIATRPRTLLKSRGGGNANCWRDVVIFAKRVFKRRLQAAWSPGSACCAANFIEIGNALREQRYGLRGFFEGGKILLAPWTLDGRELAIAGALPDAEAYDGTVTAIHADAIFVLATLFHITLLCWRGLIPPSAAPASSAIGAKLCRWPPRTRGDLQRIEIRRLCCYPCGLVPKRPGAIPTCVSSEKIRSICSTPEARRGCDGDHFYASERGANISAFSSFA